MRVHYSDLYQDRFASIAPKTKVRDTVMHAEKRYSQQLDECDYELCVKRFTRVTRKAEVDYYVLAMCRIVDEVYDVNTALLVPVDLREGLDSMDPLQMLGVLLDEFGLTIRAHYKTHKFINHEAFWSQSSDPARIWAVEPPPKTAGVVSGWMKVEPYGHRFRVQSHFVFALNLTEYLNRLKLAGL